MRSFSEPAVVLSLSEGLTLLYVGTMPGPEDMPARHVAKLMDMGLTEFTNGRFAYTGFGRTVADRMAMFGDALPARVH